MQQFLKPARGAARAGVVAAQLLAQLFVDVDDAVTPLDTALGWEPAAAFANDLDAESSRGGWLRSSS